MISSRNCVINLWNEHGWELDAGMLDFCMRIAVRYVPKAHTVDIYPEQRQANGWLEWSVRPHYRAGGTLHIGCIQRTPDVEYESHT